MLVPNHNHDFSECFRELVFMDFCPCGSYFTFPPMLTLTPLNLICILFLNTHIRTKLDYLKEIVLFI